MRSHLSQLVLMNSDGSNRVLPQPNVLDYDAMSACGDRYMIFSSYEENKARLFRADAEGANPIKLSDDARDAECAPDGKSIVYVSAGLNTLNRLSIDGGSPTAIATFPMGVFFDISPDGKWIACGYQEGSPYPRRRCRSFLRGGRPSDTRLRATWECVWVGAGPPIRKRFSIF